MTVEPVALGPIGFRISATGSAGIDWPRLDETWALAGEQESFSAGWLSDHLSDVSRERGGTAFETFTTAAALAHRVRGKWIGLAVAANTFRHPAVLAKQATMLDLITGGRFILGMGAGWHVGEHQAFGINLPEPRERVDRLESAIRVLHALFSDAARTEPGVTLADAYYPLDGATNDPAPLTAGGPPIWLGGLKPRTLKMVARHAAGWPMPGTHAGNVDYFIEQRDVILRALEAEGRDPAGFTFAAQVNAGADEKARREALRTSLRLRAAGADHVIIGIPGHAAPGALLDMAREVAEPLLEARSR
jgi:alkanesulfonate monooxygenase SsuD/methylene tetrahydromethanopterin reductase-like flavin-dependent oxidoreductase (luciferase family)